MIARARIVQASSEGPFADGLRAWIRGDDGPDAVAAGELVANTLHMWRLILESKIEK